MNTLFNATGLIEKQDLSELLKNLEEGLHDAIETDMRTKRIREADNKTRSIIKERCKNYETAERTLWYLMDSLERKLTKANEPEAPQPEAPAASDEPETYDPLAAFDPFAEIDDVPAKKAAPAEQKTEEREESEAEAPCYEGSVDDQPETPARDKKEQGEALDQSLKMNRPGFSGEL